MLLRQMLRFAPSLILPALISLLATFVYTRIMVPQDYGIYALALTSMNVMNAGFFVWVQVATARLVAQTDRPQDAESFRATTYLVFAISAVVLAVGAFVVSAMTSGGEFFRLALLCVPLAFARGLLSMNQVFHRNALRAVHYNGLECGQAALGLILGLAFVRFGHLGGAGAVLGMTGGLMLMILVDVRSLLNLSLRHASRRNLFALLKFGLPLVGALALFTLIPAVGQFIIVRDFGVAELGGYMAGYTLIDRIVSMIFMVVVTPSYPLLVNRLEREGLEGARDQTYRTGAVMLGVGLPTCVGLILASGQIDQLFIGPEFRSAAGRVMPWIAVAATVNGLTSQYFDHAFHLAKKTYLLFLTQGPAVVFSVFANLALVPRFGYIGAVYGTLGSYVALMILSLIVGRFAFPMKFPIVPGLQIVIATAVMAFAVHIIDFNLSFVGLCEMIFFGLAVYFTFIMIFNVMDIRRIFLNISYKILYDRPSSF